MGLGWRVLFPVYMVIAVIAILLLGATTIHETKEEGRPSTFGECLALLGKPFILLCFIGIMCHVGIDVGTNTTAPKILMERLGMTLADAGFATSLYFIFRTAGSTGAFSLKEGLPLKLEGGLFNGSGLTNQKEWHNTLNYSVKLQLMPWKNYNLTLSTQKIHPDKISIYMYDIGTYYEFDNWHIEAEYLYKTYAKNSFDDVHAFNAFVNYDLFIKKGLFRKISFLGRYDSMGDHSNGNADEDGKLYITDYSRQRVTGGVTLSFGKAFQADLRLNYEKYFYDKLSLAKESEQDKFVMELMVRF